MKTETDPLSGLDPLVTITELSEYLGVPVKTIYEWRQAGRGPVGVRLGRHLKFRLGDVQTWVGHAPHRDIQRDRVQEAGERHRPCADEDP